MSSTGFIPSKPLRVALLGTGLFATSAHIPLLCSNPILLKCVAVWSRQLERAKQVATTFSDTCQPYGGSDGLDALLLNSTNDIDAVIMVLPLDAQPQYVRRCLEAGLHVFSEKPIAPSITIARELLSVYSREYQHLHWSVGENYRYEPGLLAASKALKDIGMPLLLSVTSHLPFQPDNRYLKTEWRQNLNYEGGLFIDAFVHTAAAIRLLASAMNLCPSRVAASWTDTVAHIPGPDTLSALILFNNQDRNTHALQGNVSATFAGVDKRFEISVTGTEGRMEIRRTWGEDNELPGYAVSLYGHNGVVHSEHYPFGGIEAEMRAFVNTCQLEKRNENRNTPEEALGDLALVQAMLESGKEGGAMRLISTV